MVSGLAALGDGLPRIGAALAAAVDGRRVVGELTLYRGAAGARLFTLTLPDGTQVDAAEGACRPASAAEEAQARVAARRPAPAWPYR